MRGARLLTAALLVVMVAQAASGLLFPAQYRDVDLTKATWFGNDWVTLVVAVPLLFIGLVNTGRGSVQGALIWLGMIAYAVYNYAFYLFGAALNAFFLTHDRQYPGSTLLVRAVNQLVSGDPARPCQCTW